MSSPSLSLAELAAHDPRARPWSPGNRARYCCPLPECQDKKVDATHRTLTVYPEGGWTCARCKAKGKIVDAWEERPPSSAPPRRRTGRDATKSAFFLAPPVPLDDVEREPTADDREYDAVAELADLVRLPGTPSEAYMERRGIPLDLCALCRLRHASRLGFTGFHVEDGKRIPKGAGVAAVVFPLTGPDGARVRMQGRWLSGSGKPVYRLRADAAQAVFATPGAFDGPVVVIVEAPIDALSLHLCGVPAIATVGTNCPAWLVDRLALRRVALGHDDDAKGWGDKAADKIAAELRLRGALCERMRPKGEKDWNALLLTLGRDRLRADLRQALRLPEPDPFEDP